MYPIDIVLEERCIIYILNLTNSGCKLHGDIIIPSVDNRSSTVGKILATSSVCQIQVSTND